MESASGITGARAQLGLARPGGSQVRGVFVGVRAETSRGPRGEAESRGLPGSWRSGAQKGGVAAGRGASASASPSRGRGAGRLLAFERSLGWRLSSCSLVWTPQTAARGSWRCRPTGSSNCTEAPGQMPPPLLADLGSLALCWDIHGKCQPRRLWAREAGGPLSARSECRLVGGAGGVLLVADTRKHSQHTSPESRPGRGFSV